MKNAMIAGFMFLAVTVAFQQPPAPAPGRGGFNPNPTYDKVPPELPKNLKSPSLLIFSKTNGYRDSSSIAAANVALEAIAKKRGWSTFVTENAAVMNPDQLKRFDLTIWNNTSGDVLTTEQRAAFRGYIENGGAFVGIHGAGGDPSYAWDWYPQVLIGAQFRVHSSQQLGTVHFEDRAHFITQGQPENWSRTVKDEWYSFTDNPRDKGIHILATADETSYDAGRSTMGKDHPLVWTHCVGKGRVFFSAIGHAAGTYEEPNHLLLLENAIAWAAGLGGPGCPAGK
jgi:uncharacterized protein